VAVAIRRARRVRRGYKKGSEAEKNSWYYFSQLAATVRESEYKREFVLQFGENL